MPTPPKSPSAVVLADAWMHYLEVKRTIENGEYEVVYQQFGELFRKLEVAAADVKSKMARAGLDDSQAAREAGYEAVLLAMGGGMEAARLRLATIPEGGFWMSKTLEELKVNARAALRARKYPRRGLMESGRVVHAVSETREAQDVWQGRQVGRGDAQAARTPCSGSWIWVERWVFTDHPVTCAGCKGLGYGD